MTLAFIWFLAPPRFSRSFSVLAPALALLTALAARPAQATWVVPPGYSDELVVGGFVFPVSMAFFPDGRFLIVEKDSARVRLVIDEAIAANDPLVQVANVQFAGFEQGLLGVAVDPGFPTRPYFYVHYDQTPTGKIWISRYTLEGDLDFTGNGELTCDPASRYELIADIPDDNEHHNGGTLRFGPDGMLYVSIGEDDWPCNAQNLGLGLGGIMRLDVQSLPPGSGGPPAKGLLTPADNPYEGALDPETRLMWAHGMRNPFRFTIDPTNGGLYVGDVGNYGSEEVNVVPSGGLNFGWPAFEGFTFTFLTCGADTSPMIRPVYTYARDVPEDGAAITGTAVIRNTSLDLPYFPPGYDGDVFITDVYAGFLRRLKRTGDTWAIAPPVEGQIDPDNWGLPGNMFVTDMLQGPDGMLYYVQCYGLESGQTPSVRRIRRTSQLDVAVDASREVQFAAPWPSPSHGPVRFAYTLPRAARVSLTLHDVTGREVSRIAEEQTAVAGRHEHVWDAGSANGRRIESGVYFARLVVDGRNHVRRFSVLR